MNAMLMVFSVICVLTIPGLNPPYRYPSQMAVKPLVLLLVLLLSQVAAESSCAEQGFTDGLACSSCEKLKDIVKVRFAALCGVLGGSAALTPPPPLYKLRTDTQQNTP